MLRKLRVVMVRPGRDQLSGLVEVDETCVGGENPGKPGRGAEGKVIVAGAVDIRGKAANRIHLQVIPNVTGAALLGFIQNSIAPGSVILTELGYSRVTEVGYKHTVLAEPPHMHRVFGNLKTWLIGTHHGVSPQHLQAYLNEYTFRFNRRGTPMAVFQTVLGLVKGRLGPTYEGIHGVKKGRKEWIHPTNLIMS